MRCHYSSLSFIVKWLQSGGDENFLELLMHEAIRHFTIFHRRITSWLWNISLPTINFWCEIFELDVKYVFDGAHMPGWRGIFTAPVDKLKRIFRRHLKKEVLNNKRKALEMQSTSSRHEAYFLSISPHAPDIGWLMNFKWKMYDSLMHIVC